MSNPWSGQLAKSITSKKRPRAFWNVFFSIAISITLVTMSICIFQVASDNIKHNSEQIFVDYKDGYLVTDTDLFKIHDDDKQAIKVRRLISTVKAGDTLTLTISNISGELLEVKYLNSVVYKKVATPIAPTIVGCVFLCFPILGFCIFMLIVVNNRNSNGKIGKIQKQMLMRTHKR